MKITVENFREAAAKAVKDGAAQEFFDSIPEEVWDDIGELTSFIEMTSLVLNRDSGLCLLTLGVAIGLKLGEKNEQN